MTVGRSEFVTTACPSSTTGALLTGIIEEEFLTTIDDIDFDAIEASGCMGVYLVTRNLHPRMPYHRSELAINFSLYHPRRLFYTFAPGRYWCPRDSGMQDQGEPQAHHASHSG